MGFFSDFDIEVQEARLRRQWGLLPMGELHPPDRCAYCNHDKDLRRTVIQSTNAIGPVCVDVVGCARRRKQKRDAA